MRKKIVLIGGGSRQWTPEIARDMMLQPSMRDAHYVIHDPDPDASRFVAEVLKLISAKIAPDARISVQPRVPQAFSGADAFLITISTGGFAAMAHDLALPEKYGIYHTVGDTSGPGGWARAMRNIPVFVSLAQNFNRYAPRAVVLNYTNPMTVLTDVLSRFCQAPVVGLCHGLFENLEFLAKLNGIEESEISARYAGLNHFFWMLEARAGKLDLLADLAGRLRRQPLSKLMKKAFPDRLGFHSNRDVADELWRETGVFPYFGDRHTSEFFPHYVGERRHLRTYRLRRTSIQARIDMLNKRIKQLTGWIDSGVPDDQLLQGHETAANILSAWFSGKPFVDVGNVPNVGQIENLPLGVIVETPVAVDRNGFSPVAMGALPRTVLPLVEPWAHVFRETAEAGINRDLGRALRALRLDPVVGALTTPQVKELGASLLRANSPFTAYLKDP